MSQLLQNDYKNSRSKQNTSTVLLIISGVLLYTENILDTDIVKKVFSLFSIKYDIHATIPVFLEVKNLIYAIDIAISPIIVLFIFALKMKPYRWAFIVPLYAYFNMLIGTIIQALEYEIFSIWWYRLLIFLGAGIVCWILSNAIKYSDANEKSERLKNMILENYRLQLENETA